MLKHRLVFGTLMTLFFIAVVILDGWADNYMPSSVNSEKNVQGTILLVLIILLIVLAQYEFSKLAEQKGMKIFLPVSTVASVLFAAFWYLPQVIKLQPQIYLSLLLVFTLLVLFLYQYLRYGSLGIIANCGANYFSIIYLGFLSSFILAVRIQFGLWPMIMFVFAVKSSDIGAYTIGKLWGKHKFSPKISPGKTWEGMAGAVTVAIIVAVFFAMNFDIMTWWMAAVFGFCFAFIGQFGDLAESMIKRDAEQKDSANNVPGFGGILDIIDSPLIAAPFAYLFFMYSTGNSILQQVPK